LNVVPIDIPPLREHKEDIPDLAKHFLARFARENEKQIAGLTPTAIKTLLDYHWPGNVRQLENAIERAVALTANKVLDASDFQLDAAQSKSNTQSSGSVSFLPEGATLEQWEDEMIREALRRANGNKSQAARLLGLSRNALRYRLAKIGVPDDPE
jgi:DNA-binding NtrC family response regulator